MAQVAFVVSLVASVIGIIDGVKTVWDAVKDPKGQPEAFRQVASRLPLVLDILERAKTEAKKLDEAAQEDLEKVLESCKEKAEKLNKIFKKVLPGDDDGRLSRYRKAVRAPFKGGRVEELMEGILRDAQLIATDKLMGVATEEQVNELADAIKEMKEMPSSLPDETGSVSQTHTGSGHNIANMGPGSTNIQSGEKSSQYNITGTANFGDNTTIHNQPNTQDEPKWTPNQGNIHWVIPREVNPNFTGQNELLEEMKIKLCPSIAGPEHSRKCFAIIGIGGVGKSEVCLNFANTQRNKFWGVFWIDASAPSTIQRGYVDAAQRCQPHGSLEIKDFKIAKAFFDNVKHPYLFIIDNADDIKQTLHPYLPTGLTATVIITSCDYKKFCYGTVGAKTMEKLDMEDAIELLFKASNTPKACRAKKWPDAEAVVQLLAQHALAVVQAGAYIHQRPCTLKEYEVEFLQQKKRPSLLRFRTTEDFSRYGDVYATFEVSAQFLEEFKSTDQAYVNALELLGVLGHLYFTGVPQAIFTYAWKHAQDIPKNHLHADDIRCLPPWHVSKLPKSLQELPLDDGSDDLPDSLHDAFGVLRSFAIITIQLETKEISMHPLAHAWARDRLRESDKQGAWACTMSLIALPTCSCISSIECFHDNWQHLQPHAEACVDVSPQDPFGIYPAIELGRMLGHFAWLFYRMDDHLRCKAQTTKLRERFSNKDSLSRNSSWIGYIHALCLIPLDEYNVAQEILEGIVGSDEEASTTATIKIPFAAKISLAAIYLLKGKAQVAVNLLREVVQTVETLPEYTYSEIIWARHELARALSMNGKEKDAISILQNVVRDSILNPGHPGHLDSQHRLAIVLSKDGRNKEAISILRDVIQIQNSISKPEDTGSLATRHQLAVVLSRDGKHKEAILILRDVVRIHRTTINPTNINLL